MDGVDLNVGTGISQLKEFYVYNNKYGNFANEIGKILYCHPTSTSEDMQLKHVGLSEAIIKFAENFSDSSPCESLHTQKSRYVFLEPERGYWFLLVLTIPSVIKSSLEGIQVTDFQNDEVQDVVFQACLSRLYKRFILRYGRLDAIVEANGLSKLKELLRTFIDKSIHKWEPNRAGIMDIYFGLQFLPLNRQMFLRVQCFVNHLLMTWNQIKHVLILQGEKLVWSGVGQLDIQVLYDFLIRDAISSQFREGGEHENRNGMIVTCFSYLTLFDTVIVGSGSPGNSKQSQDDRVDCSEKLCHMCIYKSKQSYLVMLMYDDKTDSDFMRDLCSKVDEYLKQKFVVLAKDLADESGRAQHSSSVNGSAHIQYRANPLALSLGSGLPSFIETPTNVKYIYFNYLNLSMNSSSDFQNVQPDAYRLLADLKQDLSKMHENGEIVVKMATDNWIVGKVSNRREYYAIFNHRNSNILEIDEEMRKLTDSLSNNIFFQD